MRLRLLFATAAALLATQPAAAAGWDAAFAAALPPEELAKAAVDSYPDVSQAKAGLALAKARAHELEAGPYEFIFNANTADNYPKFTWDLGRSVRLPGKAALDRKAGALGVEAATDLVDDARHQTGILLSDAWYDWVQAETALTLDREIEAAAQKDFEAVRKREAVSDASRLDLEQAQAVLASATAHRSLSEGQAQTARLALVRGFPDLPVPARPPVLPEPPPLEHPVGEWADITVKSSHEIAIADFQAQKAEVEARRAKLDRRPDPMVGIRGIPDPTPGGGYQMKGVGFYVAVPIGGGRRAALAEASAAQASAAQINLMKTKRESAALGERNAITSNSTRLAWRSAQAAVEASEAVVRRTQKGYELGEIDLAQTLTMVRQLNETRRAEVQARVEAWKAVTHLRLDSHDLWHDAD